ncbi:Eco57I restriction-modification methylase domain-containing protein [Syntrophomonas palmitatica]|uniref:Eco57I restriction-modification methylase domain-containing protein n=1 Tax=Syntrophomonas palmitatica TaxID=402877 RepID=UPI0006CF3525|nr:TaqI-like C-terminal specificity domain-containing protein [Syntrophomonas palmitatica]
MTIREKITAALLQFGKKDLYDAGINLFEVLGYNTSRTQRLEDNTFRGFADMFIQDRAGFSADKALVNDWQQVEFLFQLSEAEMSSQIDMFDTKEFNGTIIESYAFFAIDLKAKTYTRSQLAQITREFNKLFDMPAMLVFKHGSTLTLSVINRRLHKRDKSKDVLEKVTLIKDIRLTDPHRAHVEILVDLSFDELHRKYSFSNFVALHEAWTKCLDSKELSKRFYQELANWYFWAMDKVSFPDDLEKDPDVRNATNLIRLITRIIFVWFIKEKGLVPDILFNRNHLSKVLKDFNKNAKSHSYYQAILQNLFFGTLNQKMKERAFAKDSGYPANKNEYGVKNLFRYEDKFTLNETEVLALFADIPFLNGGLFDCLDKEDENKKVVYVDGFSRETKKQAVLPDYLFFHEDQDVDLNEIYGTRNKKYRVKGLIDLLDSYKFTITENTPLEEEIALDPELLGKVFENLLASYNPETQTTARKQTGSFYTPREIVNYMVDESLLAYLQQKLEEKGHDNCEEQLRDLLSYTEQPHSFDDKQADLLIKAIDDCKILDPACGSGAFPMGMLHKLVHVLHKLDPENRKWKEQQIAKVENFIKSAETISDAGVREKVIHDLRQTLQDIEESFNTDNNELDYGRKLYLIENCIYGVDIQPIAVQIAKLRFFISLIIDQKKQPSKENLGIRSLPNLETKFVAANTLIELEKPAGQGLLRNLEIEKLENDLKELRHQYFNARTRKQKLQFQEKDKKLRQEIARCLIDDGWENSAAQQISAFNPYDQNSSSPFFDPEWMFGITDGFDIVIGNPPYVEHKKLKEISQQLRKYYSTYSGTADLYVYFYENGIRNLKPKGILIFITSNKFIKTSYGEKLREYFVGYRINEIIDFTDVHVFEALVASCIFRISKANNKGNKIKIAYANDELISFSNIKEFVNHNQFYLQQNKLNGQIWQLEKQNKLLIKDKIESGSIKISETGTIHIFRGVTTGYNPAFIIDEEQKSNFIKLDKKNNEIIKPLLQGRNIRKWRYITSNEYFINTNFDLNIRKQYPEIYKYLNNFHDKLKSRADQGKTWVNLRACTYYSQFEKEKIIWGLTADKWAFAYDNEKHYLPSNGYILTSDRIPVKYLLGLMNSKLMEFYFGFIGIMTAGGAFTLKHETISEFPIRNNKNFERTVIIIVNYILYAKESPTIAANIEGLESILNAIIYELYFPNEITTGKANILKHLKSLPDIQPLIEKGETEKALKTIEKVYRELSAPDHPVSIAMARMQEIEEVKIIEGRK